jgi:hypothetical protein
MSLEISPDIEARIIPKEQQAGLSIDDYLDTKAKSDRGWPSLNGVNMPMANGSTRRDREDLTHNQTLLFWPVFSYPLLRSSSFILTRKPTGELNHRLEISGKMSERKVWLVRAGKTSRPYSWNGATAARRR